MRKPDKTSLIIIDMQNEYFSGGALELVGIEEAASNVRRLLDHFRNTAAPVIFIQHFSAKPGGGAFVPGSAGAEINKSVAPTESDTIIQKNYPNSFRETGLLDLLRSLQTEKIVFCGAMSHMCIDTTVRAAFDLGYGCSVAADACATRDLSFDNETIPARTVHRCFMASLQWGFASVKTTDEIIAHYR